MKTIRVCLPLPIGLALLFGLLWLINPPLSRAEPQAQLITIEHTTLEDFNRGTFDRTGMTRLDDGEVTLLRIGIAGEWITTTNATGLIPRFEHASLAYHNYLYVFGGRTGAGSLRSIQYAAINTATHDLANWITATASLNTALYSYTTGTYTGVKGLAAAVLNGRVYLLGGENGDQSFYYDTVTFGRLNPDTGSVVALTTTAPLPKALSNGQVAVLGNRLYYLGGRGALNNQGNDEVYYATPDPLTGVITGWLTATARLPYKTYGQMSVATVNGRLYTLAGANVSTLGGIRADINYAVPVSATGDITGWLPINSLPRNIYGGAITAFGGQLYVIGGAWDNINQPVNEVLAALENTTGSTLTWATTSYITPVRLLHTAVVNADGWLYVVGGSRGQNQPIQQHMINAGATTGQSGSAYVDQGYYLGEAFDAGKDYPLRQLQWTIDLPDPALVTATLRYRYVPAGSSTFTPWTDWLPAQAMPGVQTNTLPLTMTARYLQYEVYFAQSDPQLSPVLQRVALTYETPDPPRLTKAAEPAGSTVVVLGERVTYTIGISNPNSQVFARSFITDPVPDHLTYVPGSIFASAGITPHDELAPDLYWEIGALPGGFSGTLGYAATVNADSETGDVIRNAATFDSDIVGTRSPTVIHTVGLPFRAEVQHVSSAPGQTAGRVQPGDLITYTLDYTNPANSQPLTGVVLTDVLPGPLSFVGAIGTPPDPQYAQQGILRWALGDLQPGVNGSVGFVARVTTDTALAPDGGFIVNIAQLGAAGQRTAVSAPDVIEIRYRYDLKLSISDDRYQAQPGELLTYTIYVTNVTALPVTVTGIQINEYLEPGLPDYLTGSVLTCVNGCPGWNWVDEIDGSTIYSRTIDSLGPNQSTAVTLVAQISPTVRVDAPDVLAVGNFAEAFADGQHGVESDPTNQSGEDITIVAGSDVLASDLRLGTPQPVPGKPFNVLVNVSNFGLESTLGPDNAGWFGVDVYVRPLGSPPPYAPDDRYLGACPTAVDTCGAAFRSDYFRFVKTYSPQSGSGLAVGETWPLTYTLSITPAGTYWVYVQADVFGSASAITATGGTALHGRLIEGNEANNVIGPLVITVDYHRVYLPIVRR